jgi:AraC family transcriptional regulator of adaptative response/methylated-DNA-[protein]-cysteine methyltransferase
MITAIQDQRLAKPGFQNAALRDYDSVRRAIAFISEHWRNHRSDGGCRLRDAG